MTRTADIEMTPDTQKHSAVIQGLDEMLAGSYILMLKTHRFHWNVQGPRFLSLHQAFEEQYRDLFDAVDAIAERIRALGSLSKGSFAEFATASAIEEARTDPEAEQMTEILARDHTTMAQKGRAVSQQADEAGDPATADLMNGRITLHEKTAWMLRSLLQ